jgi:hypothetical protein
MRDSGVESGHAGASACRSPGRMTRLTAERWSMTSLSGIGLAKASNVVALAAIVD